MSFHPSAQTFVRYCVEASLSTDASTYAVAIEEGCRQLIGLSHEAFLAVVQDIESEARCRLEKDQRAAGPVLLRIQGYRHAWQLFRMAAQHA